MKFLVHHRTRLLQIAGIAFLALCALSGTRLKATIPELCDIMFALGCVLLGVAAGGRLWCALYIAGYNDERLICEGPHSLCHNPLYFFSFM